jgi:hypothetical protein
MHTNFITCARYYNHKFLNFAHYSTKPQIFLDKYMNFFLVTKLQNCDSEHDHGLKDAPIHVINTNEKSEIFVDNIFHMMFYYYQLHYKMHNNINTFERVRKKPCCL